MGEVVTLNLPARKPAAVVCLDHVAAKFDLCAVRAAKNAHSGTADDLLAMAELIERRVAEVRNIIAKQDEARNEIMKERT